MDETQFRMAGISHPRLSQFAIAQHPAWLWSADGSRILWCNATAAAVLGPLDPAAVAKPRSRADSYRRQVGRLAERIARGDRPRLERLRGFGAPLGQLATCSCSRLSVLETDAILIVGVAALSRGLPLAIRAKFITDGFQQPVAVFAAGGERLAANRAAMQFAGPGSDFADLGLNARQTEAGRRVTAITQRGHFDLYSVGSGKDAGIIAMIEPFEINEAARSMSIAAADATEMFVIDPPAPEPERIDAPSAAISNAGAAADAGPVDRGDETAQHAAIGAETQSVRETRPLRFVWRTDAENRFSVDPGEFSRLAGPQLGRPWSEIAQATGIDPEGHAARAFATRETWNGVIVQWPCGASNQRIAVELSGVPIYDSAKSFAGYRGFGICRDATVLEPLEAPLSAGEQPDRSAPAPADAATPSLAVTPEPSPQPPGTLDTTLQQESEIVDRPKNVLPFRPAGDARIPSLSAVENHAFDEIARRLASGPDLNGSPTNADVTATSDSVAADAPVEFDDDTIDAGDAVSPTKATWLTEAADPARAESKQHRLLFDLMPTGILIYRLDRLLYANTAFLQHVQFDDLHALQNAGGLDALYAEPDAGAASSSSDAGLSLKIAAPGDGASPRDGRLVSISWDGEPAHALILAAEAARVQPAPLEQERPAPQMTASQPAAPVVAADIGAMLDSATDGILLFDRSGSVTSCNRGAEMLFGYPRADFVAHNLTDLLADESQRIVLDYFESIDQSADLNAPDHGREILGRAREGRLVPLSMTMGRIGGDGEQFFAVFRDLSPFRKTETDLLNARRRADRATSSKADALAKINHEIRSPLNTIIGFANLMIDQRFGPLGNERYAEYLKDIRASAERVLAMVNDVADISRMETGKINLSFATQSLNEIVEQCVGALQAQANRDRIIIRTSLTHKLPPVVADGQALRQITSTLITSSIRLSRAGGQVIVSTALGEAGGAVLRVRDMGPGMNEAEIAATMDPYRIGAPSDRIPPDRSGIDLSLSKALAEANRAQFRIRSTAQSGTLVEVSFPNERALAS